MKGIARVMSILDPEQVDEQRERLHAVSHLAIEIAELRDLQQVFDTALRQCLALTGSQFGFIGLTAVAGAALGGGAVHGGQARRPRRAPQPPGPHR